MIIVRLFSRLLCFLLLSLSRPGWTKSLLPLFLHVAETCISNQHLEQKFGKAEENSGRACCLLQKRFKLDPQIWVATNRLLHQCFSCVDQVGFSPLVGEKNPTRMSVAWVFHFSAETLRLQVCAHARIVNGKRQAASPTKPLLLMYRTTQ